MSWPDPRRGYNIYGVYDVCDGRQRHFRVLAAARQRLPLDAAIKLVIHKSSDGKYLAKGGRPKVWKRFGLRKEHRCLQGLVSGKRCGTTQNIGPAARIGAAGRPETSLVENVGAGQIRSSRDEMWEAA
jgi:hypothetical protein